MNVNELCKGCLLHPACVMQSIDTKIRFKVIKKCPCTICLVKVTCHTEKGCDDYKHWLKYKRIIAGGI